MERTNAIGSGRKPNKMWTLVDNTDRLNFWILVRTFPKFRITWLHDTGMSGTIPEVFCGVLLL